jgi:hypothetical protein
MHDGPWRISEQAVQVVAAAAWKAALRETEAAHGANKPTDSPTYLSNPVFR